VSTFDNIPSFSSLESSRSTCGLIENGTGLALTNLGVAFSFSVSLAFISATHPIPSLKTFEYSFRSKSKFSLVFPDTDILFIHLRFFQSRLIKRTYS
jgi:hypothetical protein